MLYYILIIKFLPRCHKYIHKKININRQKNKNIITYRLLIKQWYILRSIHKMKRKTGWSKVIIMC